MSEVPSTTPAASEGLRRRLSQPRYSVMDCGIFLLGAAVLAAVTALAVYKCWEFRRQRDDLAAAVFRSPLPEVQVAREARSPGKQHYRNTYDFSEDWFTHVIPVWEKVLAPYKGKPGVNYLEVGLYEGRSALWIIENVLTDPTSRLTGIDLFEGKVKDRFFENLRRSGAADRATIIVEPSQIVMRRLPLESFDIIYIDGSHATPDVLEDAVLSYRLLKPGGLLIFDDYRWAGAIDPGSLTQDTPDDLPKAAIDSFAQCFDKRMQVIHNSYQLILKKQS